MATCPNKNLQEWKELVESQGEDMAFYLWDKHEGNLPTNILNTSKASEQTLQKVKEALVKMGVNLQTLEEYAKSTGLETKSLNGVADLTRGVIAVAQGHEDVALTEEMVHIATAILEQTNPKLVTELISKIERFKIYKATFEKYKNNKNYQLPNGKPDIRKIKKEAVDKLIAEVIVNNSENGQDFPELMDETIRRTITSWWEAIKDFLKGVYRKSNIDIFKQAAEQIINSDIGTVEDIKETETFYQIKNDAVDKMYDTILDFDSRLDLPKFFAPGVKRHYTFDGQVVAKSVTEKIKGNSTMGERTPEQKISDDQKRDWGSEGHNFIDNYITENLIDKDGYKKETFDTTPITTTLNATIQKNLKAFAEELINSYAPGTRFVTERKVINTKEKGMLASTVDFLAIEPNEKTGMKVDILDWKFSTLDKTKDEDIPWFKRKEWQPQMGEYTKIMYQYGLQPNQLRKARMIPFISNYEYTVVGDKKSPLQLKSLEIGKLDSLTETNLYLLPVALNTESTGNKAVDTLLGSLREQWEKLYKKKVDEDEKYVKNLDLNELSKAIRFLHLKLDFDPLYDIGKTFLNNASKTLIEFEKTDISSLDTESLNTRLGELIEFTNSAKKFTTLDAVYLSNTPKEKLTKTEVETLTKLEHLAGATERMLKKIERLQTEVTIQIAVKEGVDLEVIETDSGEKRIQAEVAVNTLAKSFLEGSKLSATIVNLASNLIMTAKSLTKSSISRQMKEYENVLLPLEIEAKAKGKKAFDMIATMSPTGLSLIKKIDRAFWDEISNAKDAKNKQFFLDNMDKVEYDRLAKETIEKGIKDLNNRQFSSDAKIDSEKRQFAIDRLTRSLDIDSKDFNGYSNVGFSILFRKTMKEEGHYSREYEEMRKSKAALDVWSFFSELNNKGKEMGYLGRQGSSFFPLIEATTLEKFYQSNDVAGQSLDFFKDLYTSNVNEDQSFSKTDPETGQLRKEVPKYFTSTDKNVNQLSRDLNKVGAMWIKSLADYKTAKSLENTLLTLHSAEVAKGSLILGPDNTVIFEAGIPKVNYDVNKNAEILETIINDAIFGIKEDLGSIGNINLSTVTDKFAKDAEAKQTSVVNIRKGLKNSDTLVRSLAVGMKPLIAIANWAGYQFQAYINSGNMYKFSEFEKNNLKVSVGNLSTEETALLDLVIPLSEDLTLDMRRELAKKQGWLEYISTWSFTDVMMLTNSFPERKLQFANALSFIQNSMVVGDKIVNIRQFVKEQDRKSKYTLSQTERKTLEKTFEERVLKLKENSSLTKVAVMGTEEITIPGVSEIELAKFRTKIIEYGRNLNGQMNEDNKAGYRRDTIFSSFMMFKNWIPKLVSTRVLDIKKNVELNEWEYGRGRAFLKAWVHLGIKNTSKMMDIINGTEEGLKILDEMLEAKKIEHYRKTGQTLTITNEEFYDLMRQQLENQIKELKLLVGTMGLLIAAKVAEPPEDATDLEKNRYKFWAKAINKINDEISFYYNPTSMDAISKGSLIPSIGLLHKVNTIFKSFGKYGYGQITNDEEMMEDANPLKYFLNVVPLGSQFQTEILPYVAPDLAKEMGIRVTVEARRQ